MKIIPSILALFGATQAQGFQGATDINDCGYATDINAQIVRELEASHFYYALHYQFSTQELHRPNFAKMLAARAGEERDHADALAKFQTSRGYNVNINGLKFDNDKIQNVKTIEAGLQLMIDTEKKITGYLKQLNKKAEDGVPGAKNLGADVKDPLIDTTTCQAPHLADLMTSTYLPEQLADINELVVLKNKLEQYKKQNGNEDYAEIMFDKLILED